jgi:ribonuclease BN (tRNA processing enzyme)
MENNVKVLGVGNAFTPHLTSTSFLLENIDDDCDMLIDCGFGVFAKLLAMNYDFKRLNYILITHTHEDHIGSLSSMLYYMKYVCGRHPSFVLTESYSDYFTNQSVLDEVSKYLSLTGHSIHNNIEEIYDISTFPTNHTDIPSAGYVIPDYGIFTGDTKPCKSIATEWDRTQLPVYHDVQLNGSDPLTTPHTTLDELLFYYDPHMVNDIIGVHYGDAAIANIKLAKVYNGKYK